MTLDDNGTSPKSAFHHVVGLFSGRVRHDPGAIAVVCGDRQLTYQQLDVASNQGARFLSSLGVGKQTLVAICMPRGVDAIVAFLSVLKAGATFVSLDSSHPRQRLLSSVEAARPAVLLTDRPEEWADRVPDVRVASAHPFSTPVGPGDELPTVISGTDLAYVIYTSGSTGQPKGVMIEHEALGCHIEAMCRLYELGPGDRVLQHSSLAFDTSLEAIFCALAAGAQLIVQPDLLGAAELIDTIDRHAVTWIELTPAYWAQVVDVLPSLGASPLGGLRMLVLGGDAVPAGTLEKFMSMRPAIEVLNTYGPTEATIGCVAFRVPRGWHGTTVPIGRPCVPGKPVYVLDDNLDAVLEGDIGEICVGGLVARGYLHDPILTAERFVTRPPSGGVPAERVYRTGDRGSKGPDGTIEFFGRVDRQVKIRGTRVEPAEIEGVLSRHPAVLAVVVAPVGDGLDRELIAYVQWVAGAREATADLRDLARDHLPGAMLPTSWISVDSIPTTVAGKVDLAALTQVEGADQGGVRGVPDEPSTTQGEAVPAQLEEVVASIWRDVLSVPTVAPQDNFFDLGGHSLAAMVLVFRLTEEFSVEIPLTAAFTYPTPQDMAEFLERRIREEDDSSVG